MNRVRLRGRLVSDPQFRSLANGDSLWSFRVVIPRSGPARALAATDALDCVAWEGRISRTVQTWREGDEVEVAGALRRRFFRSGAATVSRVEVEAVAGRLIRRGETS
ncbi:single-stranded DNA-binding protein [Nocardioides sp.]|uniref:single-stranded DNA-binding protein n=1 Tax=Nocardioides sp. TaxID=35761 RepID=UPI003D1354E8